VVVLGRYPRCSQFVVVVADYLLVGVLVVWMKVLMLPLEARLRLKWQGERAEFRRNGRQTKPGHATK
jgi:hypothetical protein